SKNGTRLLLLGVENQKEIHYGMPLKSLTYDVLGYINEANAIARKRKKEKTITSAEFLSGMKKGDKLTPIITLVIYYGEDPWDGPLSLQDMLRDMSAENIYHQTTHNITLLQVRNSDEFQFHNEEIETVFHVSRELFRGNTEGIREEYKNSEISEELISMVGCITGVHHITECAKEGERNMCRAIDEMLKKLEEETAKRVEEETTKHVVKLENERVCREMLKNSISREIIEKVSCMTLAQIELIAATL
ncbi:MAG: Rpn family recombination-promoting nuclease/putative transposase, partial [Eubacteriales bacterium]